jgi:hypothetical protein
MLETGPFARSHSVGLPQWLNASTHFSGNLVYQDLTIDFLLFRIVPSCRPSARNASVLKRIGCLD